MAAAISLLAVLFAAFSVNVNAMESFREYVESTNRTVLLCSAAQQQSLIEGKITDECLESDDYAFVCTTCGKAMHQYALACVGTSFAKAWSAGCSQDRQGRYCGAVFTDNHDVYDRAVSACGTEGCTSECNTTLHVVKTSYECCSSVETVYAVDHEWENEVPALLDRCDAPKKPVCDLAFSSGKHVYSEISVIGAAIVVAVSLLIQ